MPTRALLVLLAALAGCVDELDLHTTDREGTGLNGLEVVLPDVRITIVVPSDANFALGTRALQAWVERSARAVREFYGRFPVPHLELALIAENSAEVGNAVTRAESNGASIRLGLGKNASERALRNDWVLVHEMIHTALPSLPPAQRWLEGGLATYLEGVVRCRAGLRDPRMFWSDFTEMAPEGLAKADAGGLDGTVDWGRTYWGGATFCLLLDLAIRERSQDTKGLRTALVGVLDQVGDVRRGAQLAEILVAMDAAIGAPVASELHAAHGPRRSAVDLVGLWRDLGIEGFGRNTRFVDTARLAATRRAILTRAAP